MGGWQMTMHSYITACHIVTLALCETSLLFYTFHCTLQFLLISCCSSYISCYDAVCISFQYIDSHFCVVLGKCICKSYFAVRVCFKNNNTSHHRTFAIVGSAAENVFAVCIIFDFLDAWLLLFETDTKKKMCDVYTQFAVIQMKYRNTYTTGHHHL